MSLDLSSGWTDAGPAVPPATVDDHRDWRREGTPEGVADLADKANHPACTGYDDGLQCRFETWMAGTDIVGPGAASAKTLEGKRADAVRADYPELTAGRRVYVDLKAATARLSRPTASTAWIVAAIRTSVAPNWWVRAMSSGT